jgi:hypothetical protein
MRQRERNLWDDPIEASSPQYDMMIFVLACLSNAATILCRYNVGFRMLQPWVYRLHIAFLLYVGYWMIHAGDDATVTTRTDGFCLWVLAVGIAIKFWWLRARAQKMAYDPVNPLHTRSRGNSYMTKNLRLLRIPEPIIQRWLEPFTLFFIGAGLVQLHFNVTGFYLAVSGATLAMVESHVQDAAAEARAYQQVVPAMQTKESNTQPTAPPRTTATLSPELLKLRKNKKG